MVVVFKVKSLPLLLVKKFATLIVLKFPPTEEIIKSLPFEISNLTSPFATPPKPA